MLASYLKPLYTSLSSFATCTYDTGWIHALKEDLLWLSLSGELSCSCDDLNAVEALIQSGLPFIRMVRRYVATKFANLDVPQALPRFAESSFAPVH